MDATSTGQLVVIGCSHRVASVQIREALFPDAERVEDFFEAARRDRFKADEAALLLTCSRAEFYLVTEQPSLTAARVQDWLLANHPEYAAHTYTLAGDDVVGHLFSVCAGLDSIMLGEHEILGQVRQAMKQSQQQGTVGKILEHFFQSGLKTGRRARQDTKIGKGGTSLAFAAADTARSAVPPSMRGRVVVLGAGQTGALAATHFAEAGWSELVIINRTLATAEKLASRLGGKALPIEDLQWAIRGARAVVTAAGGARPLISPDVMTDRSAKPVIVLDLGRPRNVDPAVGEMPGVELHDLDGLQKVAEGNRCKRALEIPLVEPIVVDEARRFRAWLAHRAVVPMVKMLRSSFAGIAEEELSKHAHLFREDERENLEKFTRSLLNKLLHKPTCQLKELAELEPGQEERLTAFNEIFASAGWGAQAASSDEVS